MVHHVVPNSERPSPSHFTVENLFNLLRNVAGKWKLLGEALSLDNERLDEISTNNSGDEVRLTGMLETYMERSDHNRCQEEICTALRGLGEEQLANLVSVLGTNSGR